MIRKLLAALALMVLAQPVWAHQQKIVITTMSNNPRTGMLEVSHRVPMHDAEHALHDMKEADIARNQASRDAFAVYVGNHFALTADDEPVELEMLGNEVDGAYLWIYQIAPAIPEDTVLAVRSSILTDIWPSQENRVNLGEGTSVETLIFHAGDGFKQRRLP
ncbi:DUF6702 family protein [Aurantiacibacter flavus]|uniref:DUF6702 family protein n=1 Tax=Aurantiacibacter flavus TaxID=3145232 RepID=A0ABV0CV93_9SPHN